MKKIIYPVLGLVVVFIGVNVDALAQAKWLPKSILINAPYIGKYTRTSECPSEESDTSWEFSGIASIGYSTYGSGVVNYSRKGDAITIGYGLYSRPECNSGFFHLTFTLDSIDGKLKDFNITTGGTDWGTYNCYSASVGISSINFVITEDSLLQANLRGSILEKNISDISYEHTWSGNCHNVPIHPGQWHEGWGLTSLTDDTIHFNCAIVLVIPQPPVVAVREVTHSESILHAIFQDHSTYFTFSSSDHPQQVTIYDILGREILRIEIPIGSSSYQLCSASYPKGTYFARLGLQTANFIVN